MNDENLQLVGTLYAAGARGYSAYEIAVQNGFSGTEQEWLESIVGATGPEGPEGPQGEIGPIGATPQIKIGNVTTVSPTTPASASITGTIDSPKLNLSIPQGVKGDQGTTNYTDLTNKPKINGVSLEGNKSLSSLGIQPAGSYATPASLSNYVNKSNIKTITDTTEGNVYDVTYVNSVVKPTVITSEETPYTIDSLVGNKVFKLTELSSLTITTATTFDKETVIYFSSGATGTSVSLPSSITNLGDVPTMTEADGVNTGTCSTNKNYIISVLNNIAIWKEY